MGRPTGGIIFYGKKSSYDMYGKDLGYSRVREKDRRAYILPDSDAFPATKPRTYCGNGQTTTFTVSEFAETIIQLNSMKF